MNETIESVRFAKRVVQWMVLGAVASQANASVARQALAEFNVPTAAKVTSAIERGIAPSAALCNEAVTEIDLVIDSLLDADAEGATDHHHYDRGG